MKFNVSEPVWTLNLTININSTPERISMVNSCSFSTNLMFFVSFSVSPGIFYLKEYQDQGWYRKQTYQRKGDKNKIINFSIKRSKNKFIIKPVYKLFLLQLEIPYSRSNHKSHAVGIQNEAILIFGILLKNINENFLYFSSK